MKELTRIITIQATTIVKFEDEDELISKDECKSKIATAMKTVFELDDCAVTNVQDFIMDVKEEGDCNETSEN